MVSILDLLGIAYGFCVGTYRDPNNILYGTASNLIRIIVGSDMEPTWISSGFYIGSGGRQGKGQGRETPQRHFLQRHRQVSRASATLLITHRPKGLAQGRAKGLAMGLAKGLEIGGQVGGARRNRGPSRGHQDRKNILYRTVSKPIRITLGSDK